MKDSQRRAMFARMKPRFHKGDAWGRGSYSIPARAVLGGSDCGEWSDSPAKGSNLLTELKQAQTAFRKQSVKTVIPKKGTASGNAFCSKGWLLVRNPNDFKKGQSIAKSVLKDRKYDLLHDADE